MRLLELQKNIPNIQIFQDSEITFHQVKRSNYAFEKGDCFCAIPGHSWDGHQFIKEAIKQNPSLVVFSDPSYEDLLKKNSINYLMVEDSRILFEKLLNQLAGCPTENMFCVGVTGTNGKTTTNYCVESLLTQLGFKVAVMGTIDHHLGDKVWDTKLTSPGPEEFYPRILSMKQVGADALSMEISSHALDQHRNHSVALDVAIFTNLTQDHLDYHGSMEKYFEAKQRIATELLHCSSKQKKLLVVNRDDSHLKNWSPKGSFETLGFGKSDKADLKIEGISEAFSGQSFYLSFKGQRSLFKTKLVGEFNLYNIAASLAIGLFQGKSLKDLVPLVENFNGVSGRLEPITLSKPDVFAFVDFAHTPDALSSSLSFLDSIRKNEKSGGRIICVFGAGGDRDKTKRPLMAKQAEKYADLCIITSDNPRTEDPEEILNDIDLGFSEEVRKTRVRIVDRKEAILKALSLAESGDVVVIAGKGHENYQEVHGKRHHFSDQEIVKSY